MQKAVFIFCASLFIVLFFFACDKESFSGKPFYEVIEGSWRLDSQYTINGTKFRFDDYDISGTILKFDKGKDHNVWNCGEGMEIDDNDNENFLSLSNENGLIYKSDLFLSELPKLLDLNAGDGRGKYVNDKWIKLGYTNTHVILNEKLCQKYCDQGSSGDSDRYDCTQNLQEHIQLDQVKYFSRYNFDWEKYDRYSIRFISASELEITAYNYFYGRVINGEKVFDEIRFKIFRLNNSDVITIPPFHPNTYSYAWWHNFNGSGTGLVLKGTAVSNSSGIDNGCISFVDENSYAEWDRRPYPRMTQSFWVKPNTLSKPKQVLYSKYKNAYGPFIMSLEQDKFVVEINDGSGNLQKVSSVRALKPSEWNHICITVRQDNFATVYINGEADSNGTINSFDYDASAKILLGTTEKALNENQDITFRGYLDEFIFFNEVFVPAEVKQLYIWHLTN